MPSNDGARVNLVTSAIGPELKTNSGRNSERRKKGHPAAPSSPFHTETHGTSPNAQLTNFEKLMAGLNDTHPPSSARRDKNKEVKAQHLLGGKQSWLRRKRGTVVNDANEHFSRYFHFYHFHFSFQFLFILREHAWEVGTHYPCIAQSHPALFPSNGNSRVL